MIKIVIGLCGKKRSGKGLAAAVIKACDQDFAEVAFGDALKEECARVLGITVDEIDDNKEFYRPFLQWYGSSFRRSQDEKYWINALIRRSRFNDLTKVVISDVRFENEIDWVHSQGGFVLHISRDYPEDENSLHISEQVDKLQYLCDASVINDGTPAYVGSVAAAFRAIMKDAISTCWTSSPEDGPADTPGPS